MRFVLLRLSLNSGGYSSTAGADLASMGGLQRRVDVESVSWAGFEELPVKTRLSRLGMGGGG